MPEWRPILVERPVSAGLWLMEPPQLLVAPQRLQPAFPTMTAWELASGGRLALAQRSLV